MKKYYSLFLFWGVLIGLSTSCSDDDTPKDPYLPTSPRISIGNPSGQTSCFPGETIELKAILNNPLPTDFQWQLNKKTVSTDSVYRFTSQEPGNFEIILTATNRDGKDSDTLFLKVNNGEQFTVSDLKNWTGDGENTSVLAIQWTTGDQLLEPADHDIFFIAWGYRWDKTATPTGIDMLKAIAKNDPRLYVALSGDYIRGFGYDGNNDGKIELKSSTLHLTQDDFTNGLYKLNGYDSDKLKPSDAADYWMGSDDAYTTYWLGSGSQVPAAADFEYSQTFVGYRRLENLSWDVWTLSPIDYTTMANVYPIPRLIKAAEANK